MAKRLILMILEREVRIMKSKEALNEIIRYCSEEIYDINEITYENPLQKECDLILQDLERLEKLKKIFSDLKSMFEIKIGIDIGNEYFMEIKQLDDRIAELIPIEDIEIFKEVLECQKD